MSDDTLDTTGAVQDYLKGPDFLGGPDPATQARVSVAGAVGTNSDLEAELRRVAQRTGVPMSSARAMPEDVKRRATLADLDFDDMAQRLPSTVAFLAEKDNALVAHDDIENMGLVESTLNSFKRGWRGLKQLGPTLTLANQGGALANIDDIDKQLAAGKKPEEIASSQLGPLANMYAYMTLEERAAFRKNVVPTMPSTVSKAAARVAELQVEKQAIPAKPVAQEFSGAKTWGEAFKALARNPLDILATIGPESLVQSAPGIAAAIPATIVAGPAGGAATIGANSFAVDYAATVQSVLQESGVDLKDAAAVQKAMQDPAILANVLNQASKHAGVVAAVDAVSGGMASKVLLPASVLAKKPVARAAASVGVQTVTQGALGAAGEAGGQVAAGQELQPGQILAEAVGEFFGTPAEVAGMSAGRIRDAARQRAELRQKVIESTQDAQSLQALVQTAAKSKLMTRDPQALADFVQKVADKGDAPSEVFVDAKAFAEALNQNGITVEQAFAAMPSIERQFAEATASGGDIAIPIGEFTAGVAGSPIEQALMQHVRTDPEALSQVESTQLMKGQAEALKATAERIIAEQGVESETAKSAATVRGAVYDQLQTVGRFKSDVNAAYADMVRDFYTVQAQRLGLTPEELFKKHPLTIKAEGLVARESSLQQNFADTSALDAWLRENTKREPDQLKARDEGVGTITVKQGEKTVTYDGGMTGRERVEHDSSDVRLLYRLDDGSLIWWESKTGKVHTVGANDPRIEFKPGRGNAPTPETERTPFEMAVEVDGEHHTLFVPDDPARLTDAEFDDELTMSGADDAVLAAYRRLRTDRQTLKQDDRGIDPGAAALELGKIDGLFQYPKSAATDMVAMAAEKNPGLRVERETITQPDGSEKPTGNWNIRTPSGDDAIVTERDGKVWINVAGLAPGGGGSLIYDLVANYALNNGLKFIGDPAGLSDAAMVRRTENMLSSAIKYGTTDHLEPHPKQLKGNDTIPALTWKDGDTAANVRSMMEAVVTASAKLSPSGSGVEYDAATGQVTDSEGVTLDADGLRALANLDRGAAGAGAPGRATLQRAALFRALLSGPDGQRGVLESLRRLPSDGGALAGSFYQDEQVTPRGTFAPATGTITLLAKADLSTFLHETGHFYLETLAAMASAPDAPAEIVQDMQTVLEWFGIDGVPDVDGQIRAHMKAHPEAAEALRALNRAKIAAAAANWEGPPADAVIEAETKLLATPGGEALADLEDQRTAQTGKPQTALQRWQAMSLEQQRQYHEKFARGFEAYLFEGKAPSTELTRLFGRFRAWLTHIYKSIRALDVEINDDIRSVFDRLLASEQQIKEAEAARAYAPLFADEKALKEAGVDPAAYHALGAEATEAAVTDLQRRSLRDMQWLTNAKGRALKALQKEAKEKRKAIEAQVREEVNARPEYRAADLIAESDKEFADDPFGADPGLRRGAIADALGFPSVDTMVRAIEDAPPRAEVIEGMTDQRMLEEHGELSSPEALQRAAEEAIHNEVRGKFIATELSALNKALGPARVLVAAAKQFAEAVIGRKQITDIKPHLFVAAETRAAKQAEKSLGKSTDEAAIAKRNQLLNHYAARYARDALSEIDRIREFFKKVADTPDDRLKSRDMDVVNAARAVLAAYGVGRKGEAAAEYLKRVAAYDPEMSGVLQDSVDAALASAKPLAELTLDELRALNDEVASLWHLAKRSRQMEIDGDLLDREEVQEDLKARLVEIGIPDRIAGEGSAVTPAEQRLAKLKTYLASARRTESWVGAMDGANTGVFRRYIWQPVKEAADAYRTDRAKLLKQYRELLDTIAPTMRKRIIDAPELGYTFGKDTGGVALNEILHAILHTGNSSNKKKLLLGRKWATENADGTIDTSRWDAFVNRMAAEGVLTKAHFDFVQGVWNLLESTKPLAQKTHRDVFGKYFAEVTAEPVATPFGQYAGGYAPAVADPRVVSDAQTRKLMEDENASMAFAFPATNRGFTKGRVEYNRPLTLDLGTLAQHIDKVLLFSHMERPIRDVRRVLTAKGVAYGVNRIDPAAFDSIISPWLNRAARQQVTTPSPGHWQSWRLWSVLRNRAGMAAMFGNVVNAAQQITGFSIAAVKVRPKYLLGAMAHYVANPRQMAADVAAASPYMEGRISNEIAAMNEAIRDILIDPSLYERTQQWTMRHAYFMQSAVDNVMSPIIWIAARNQALEQGQSEKDAGRFADATVRQTQGSTLPEDISNWEAGSSFSRMFSQFAGYFNMQANLLGTEFQTIARDMGLRKGTGRGLYVLVLAALAPAWVSELIVQAFRGGPDDEDKDGEYLDDWLQAVFGMATLRGLTAMIPIFGQGANAVVNAANSKPYDDRLATSPAVSMVEGAVRAPVDVYKAAFEDGDKSRAVKDVASLISLLTGIPANIAARPLSYAVDVQEGDVNPTGPADAARGLVTGRASPGSK